MFEVSQFCLVFLGDIIQPGVVFCIHLVLLLDEIMLWEIFIMFKQFLNRSVALEPIHSFKTNIVTGLMGKVIEKGKLKTGIGGPQVLL